VSLSGRSIYIYQLSYIDFYKQIDAPLILIKDSCLRYTEMITLENGKMDAWSQMNLAWLCDFPPPITSRIQPLRTASPRTQPGVPLLTMMVR